MKTFLLIFFSFFLSSYAHQWSQFLGLTGFRLGDTNPTIPDLKKYLNHFGYHANSPKFTDIFDEDLHSALKTYQLNFNLEPTGILDTPTVSTLMTPRCGVPDFINGTITSMSSGKRLFGRLHYSFPQGYPRWSKWQLTYAITYVPAGFSIDIYTLRQVFARSFSRWQAVTNFRFTEVGPYNSPDITIGFYRGDHGDGWIFDGPTGLLAHGQYPPDGRFHLDVDEYWSVDISRATSPYAYDLESVSVHEIGHLLGLDHSSVGEAIMYPQIPPRTRKVNLANDDIVGIRTLYGLSQEKQEPELHVAY